VSDELITIGTFSLLTGLSITTLRHYDEIGLVIPAHVDRETGYRRYSSAQVERARQVRLLRDADVPAYLIAQALDSGDEVRHAVLTEHRSTLHERAGRAEEILKQLLDHPGEGSHTMRSTSDFRLATLNIGVDSDEELDVVSAFWSHIFGTALEDWGNGGRQVVLGTGNAIGFFNLRVRSTVEPHFGHRAAFGLAVVGLADTHARAVDAGALELYPPTDGVNMPRHSLISDPVGNQAVLWESSE